MATYTVKSGVLNDATMWNNARKLVRKSDGTLWCVYEFPGINQEIRVSYSIDNGVTWTEEIAVASDTEAYFSPALAVDSQDRLHLVYRNETTEKLEYRRRTTLWLAEEIVENDYDGDDPCIAIDSQDNVHVAFIAVHPSYLTCRNIRYRKRDDATDTWSAAEWVTEVGTAFWGQFYPAIAIDSLNNVHLVWEGTTWGLNPTVYNIRYRKRTAGGWQAHEAVTDVADSMFWPVIALDSYNYVHVAWHGAGIEYRQRTDSWQTKVVIAASPANTASIALDRADNIYILYQESGTGDDIYCAEKLLCFDWLITNITNVVYDNTYPILMWACHPTVLGEKTNVIFGGYALVFTADVPASPEVRYFSEPRCGPNTNVGSGTVDNPYVITDVCGLHYIHCDLSVYYELGSNIDASKTVDWFYGAGFIPIGTIFAPFTGHFDGKGYTVDGLFINRLTEDSIGLFGAAEEATVLNVNLTNVNITGRNFVGAIAGQVFPGLPNVGCLISGCGTTGIVSAVDPTGGIDAGGIVGYNYRSTIRYCISSVSITGTFADQAYYGGIAGENDDGIIEYCHAFGDMAGDYDIGGLVGKTRGASAIIRYCYATGHVTGVGDYRSELGGLVGWQNDGGTIYECFALGDVTGDSELGGFIGWTNGGTISDCYARGDVTSTPPANQVGGFVGLNDKFNPTTISNCYSTGLITTTEVIWIGGFCGYDAIGVISNCFWDVETSGMATSQGGTGETTGNMKIRDTFTAVGWDFINIWNINPTCNDSYPCLLNTTPDCPFRRVSGGTLLSGVLELLT